MGRSWVQCTNQILKNLIQVNNKKTGTIMIEIYSYSYH